MKRVIVAIVMVFLLCLPITAATNKRLSYYRYYLTFAKEEARKKMQNDDLRGLIDSVHFVVMQNGELNSFSYVDSNGEKMVILTSGLLNLIESVQVGLIFEAFERKAYCSAGYLNYLTITLKENDIRLLSKKTPSPVFTVFGYAEMENSLCSGLTEDWYKKETVRQLIGANMYGCIYFIAMHEFAHHVYGHVGRNIGDKEEMQADNFALDILPVSPISLSALMRIYYWDNVLFSDCAYGKKVPFIEKRYLNILDAAERWADRMQTELDMNRPEIRNENNQQRIFVEIERANLKLWHGDYVKKCEK